MADLGFAPVAGRVPAQPGTSLADMISMAGALQQYQQAQQMNPLTLEAQRLAVQQAQAVNPLLQRQQQAATSLAEETLRPRIEQQRALTGTAQTEEQRAKFALSGDQFKAATDIAGALAADPRVQLGASTGDRMTAVTEAFSAMTRRGFTPEQAFVHAAPFMAMAQMAPDQLPQALKNVVLQGVGTGGQLPGVTPQLTTGPGGTPITYTAGTGTIGQPKFATGAEAPIIEPTGEKDINNNPIANVRDPKTNRVIGQTTIPAGVPAATTLPAPARMRAGETSETYRAAQDVRIKAQEAATQVPQQKFNNNKIVELVDKAITGAGAETLRNLTGGYAALPFTSDMATNLDQLGHYMALQTGTLAAGAGLGTDAARSLAAEQAGKTSWTADAIKSTARINRALSVGTSMFSQGVNNAVQQASNDPIAARDFQEKWSRQVDVNVLRLLDATEHRQTDPQAYQKLLKEFGPDGVRKLIDKARNLRSLVGSQ